MTVHFLAVDVTMAGPLLCIWLTWRQSRHGDRSAARLDVELARASLWALAVGVAVGCLELAILWLADDLDFWRAVRSVAAGRLWFSLAELVFFALCMAAYLWLTGRPIRRPRLAAILALLASLDLMAHFPPLFTMLNVLADRPSLFDQRLESRLYRALLFDPEVLSMTLHVYLAAIAVTAVMLMDRATRLRAEPAVVLGSARTALLATLLQLPLGVCVLLSVPNRLRDALLGEDLLATLPFAVGILTTLGLLHHLAAVALGDCEARQVRRSLWLMLATVMFMTATLERIRQLGRPVAGPIAAALDNRSVGRQ